MNRGPFIVVGLGSIGRRHLQNLRALVPDAKIGVVRRTVPPKLGEPLPEGADAVIGSIDEALKIEKRDL